jgi:hypothetical protein
MRVTDRTIEALGAAEIRDDTALAYLSRSRSTSAHGRPCVG